MSHDDNSTAEAIAVEQSRPRLRALAYRLLGSAADADDAVQEAYVRWYDTSPAQRATITMPEAWLAKTLSRICLDQLKSARVRRERYVGPWLPEPVAAATAWTSQSQSPDRGDPAERTSLDESISMALLVVLETMTPAERVSFVLHDVFQYSFKEIAEIVGRTDHACRQLASSARRKAARSQASATSPEEHGQVVRAFKHAWATGNLNRLIHLLDPHAVALTDGGGKVTAATEPLVGAETIARFLLMVREGRPALEIVEADVNGEPGLIARYAGATVSVISLAVEDGRIHHVWSMRNPDKLTEWR